MAKRHTLLVACIISASNFSQVKAQTTLSGDHIITGKLDVGSSGTPGGITVAGQTGNIAAPGIKVTGDGGVVFMGTLGIGQIPAVGAGTRFMWYPRKGALRAGEFSSWQLDDLFIGVGSVAFTRSSADGTYSTAMSGGSARGEYSTAMSNSEATGEFSTGMSRGSAFGSGSTAMGMGIAVGEYSTAMSFGYTEGNYSTAMTYGSAYDFGSTAMSGGEAFAPDSIAMSGGATYEINATAMSRGVAFGIRSTAMTEGYAFGTGTTAMSGGVAVGGYSTAIGNGASAASFNSVAVGRYNSITGSENAGAWVPTDPLFVIGNGTGDYENHPPEVASHNALIVYKNGKIKMDRQGDILMGEFGNSEQ